MSNSNRNTKTHISIVKWLLIGLLLVAGFLCLLGSREIHKEHELWSLILDLVGAFLVIAIPVEILREIFFEKDNRDIFVQDVSKLFDDKIDAELVQARKFGLDHINDSLPIKELFNGLESKDTLWWLDTFYPGHAQWIHHVEQAVIRGASVRMLILDPKSKLCVLRAREIEFTEEQFKGSLSLFLNDFQECQRKLTKQCNGVERLSICLYDNLLGVPCYVVERGGQAISAYSSMYLTKPTGVEFPHFHWKQGPMCEILFCYVKNKWQCATQNKNRAIKSSLNIP